MKEGKIFCVNCKYMKDFTIHVPKLTKDQDFRCLKYPEIRITPLSEDDVFKKCIDINKGNDCKGFKQIGKIASFFRAKPR